MNHVSSVRSLGTASSRRSQKSESSTFEKILPQEAENLDVRLPRGMRFALSMARQPGKAAKTLEDTGRTYNVIVEPHGRTDMVKEMLRHGEAAIPEEDYEHELPVVRYEDPAMDAIIDERHDRSVFRKERIQKFQTHRFVPALVSDRLVPCWRSAAGSNEACPAAEAQRKLKAAMLAVQALNASRKPAGAEKNKKKERRRYQRLAFITPTVSMAMKRQKKAAVEPLGWQVTGNESGDVLHQQTSAFESGGVGPCWEEVDAKNKIEARENRRQWLSHDVIPAGTGRPCSKEVQEIRDQSKINLQSLRTQYGSQRTAHQKRMGSSTQSSFDRYYDYKVKEKREKDEADRKAAEAKPEEPPLAFAAGCLSLGFGQSKHRATQPDVGGGLPPEALK